MQLNSLIFLFAFLPVSLVGWHALNRLKKYNLSMLFLVIVSAWFYLYASLPGFALLAGSICFNFGVSKVIEILEMNKKATKLLEVVAIVANILLLAYFKYRNFFFENLNNIFKTGYAVKALILPLGISFFTLQQIAFIIDRYRGDAPHYSFVEYAAFVLYFPKLSSGPIVYHNELILQFREAHNSSVDYKRMLFGLFRFVLGLAKKMLLADTFALYVNYGVENTYALDTLSAWFVAVAFSIELYFDFSGYCDMAVGVSEMFGISLPENFEAVYKAKSLKEFWRLWHITLTRFFTKYIYIPLGGSRKGVGRLITNTLIVFFISGLWHGANWNFIIWGLLHGMGILISRLIHKKYKENRLSQIATFIFVTIAWAIFRVERTDFLMAWLNRMFTLSNHGYIVDICSALIKMPELYAVSKLIGTMQPQLMMYIYEIITALIVTIAVVLLSGKTAFERIEVYREQDEVRLSTIIGMSLLLAWCVVSFSQVSVFIYFSF